MLEPKITKGKLVDEDENIPLKEGKEKGLRMKQDHLTAAYQNFKSRLTTKFLIAEDVNDIKQLEDKLKMIKGNISYQQSEVYCCLGALGCICLFPFLYYATRTKFQVKANHFALVMSYAGNAPETLIYGPGYHFLGRYYKLVGIYTFNVDVNKGSMGNLIVSPVGDLQIAIVDQGTIMHFELSGQNIILGPGIHKITDPVTFIKTVSLADFFIDIGPETWVTIPDGYDGISVDLGEIKVLKGGVQHHLPHVGDKFVKMIPKSLLTDSIPTDISGYIDKFSANTNIQAMRIDPSDPTLFLHTTTAEGSAVILDAMVFWRITDTLKAALNAMEILVIHKDYNESRQGDEEYQIRSASTNINYLRKIVLRIVKHYLTAQVGECSLASDFSLAAVIKKEVDPETKKVMPSRVGPKLGDFDNDFEEGGKGRPAPQQQKKGNQSFDLLTFLQHKQDSLVETVNRELKDIGVNVENLCIFSVIPSREIQKELDRQTKARVDANTSIIEATAQKRKIEIDTQTMAQKKLEESKAFAQSLRVRAEGESESITLIAKARKNEADELAKTGIAMDLAKIRASGEAGEKIFKGDNNRFVFGQNPGDVIFSMVSDMYKKGNKAN